MSAQIDLNAPAILLWLAEPLEPSPATFGLDNADPTQKPEPWPRFDDAFRSAMNTPRSDERLPWIKVGDQILSPTDLRKMYVPSADEDH